jgi:single-stranded DNA-specific DHH superfamily exonuclease
MEKKTLVKIRKFLETPGKRLLFYHHDADGVCSAALLLKFFPGFESMPREGPRMEDDLSQDIVKKNPSLLAFLDIPIDQEWRALREIRKKIPGLRVLIIDHHIPERDLNSSKILHYNPRFRRDVYLPAAYLVYKILEGLGKGVKPFRWIAGMGIIGDYGFRECRGFLEGLERENPGILKGDPLASRLGKATELISYAITLKGLKGARESLELLVKGEDFEGFAKTPRLNKWKKTVEGEIRKILERFERERILYQKIGLIEYQIRSRLNITSIISTILATENPDKIIMIVKEAKAGFKISIRCQSGRLNAGELVKKAVKGIGSGGGHKKAAGALVRDLELFRKRFARLLS